MFTMSNPIQFTDLTTQQTAESKTAFPLSFLTEGDSGDFVQLLQRFLVVYGYFKNQTQQGTESVDGQFGRQTTAEVMKFQGDHFLNKNKDGQVGGLTWRAIAFPHADPNVRGALNPIVNSLSIFPLLQSGDQGVLVLVLQRLLLLYAPQYIPANPMIEADIDGLFGANTKAAVTIFQKNFKHGKLTADGQVGNKTWSALLHPSGQNGVN
jgi:peptidoglycan hydrolase-like protein with peptidoglycan-binding domain